MSSPKSVFDRPELGTCQMLSTVCVCLIDTFSEYPISDRALSMQVAIWLLWTGMVASPAFTMQVTCGCTVTDHLCMNVIIAASRTPGTLVGLGGLVGVGALLTWVTNCSHWCSTFDSQMCPHGTLLTLKCLPIFIYCLKVTSVSINPLQKKTIIFNKFIYIVYNNKILDQV